MKPHPRWTIWVLLAALGVVPCRALDPAFSGDGACNSQNADPPRPAIPAQAQEQEPPGGKRVFGVLPNYRTASSCEEGNTIDAARKIQIALKDSFDYPLVLLSAGYAGFDQFRDDPPSYGGGVKGYAKRLAANYADQAIGNIMTEGLLPVLFHQDPRYFQRGKGHTMRYRFGYALSRVIVTDSDSGRRQFNYSEWLGNAAAVGVSNLYNRDDRTASANAVRLFEYVGIDAVSQVLKEFWPDIKERWFHHGSPEPPCAH
jgi:hypothetical protein